jgi:hypothetical protein
VIKIKYGISSKWKSNLIPIYKKGDKNGRSNYQAVPTILLSRLTPYVDEIIGQLFIRLQENFILSAGRS